MNNTMGSVPRVGVVGLGAMGLGTATALREAGLEVTGCDISAQACAAFEARGGRCVATPEVLAAYLDVDPAQARQLISERGESFYKDMQDAQARMRLGEEADLSQFSVASDYFLVRGMVRFGRIENELMSLLHRIGNTVEVQWQYRL